MTAPSYPGNDSLEERINSLVKERLLTQYTFRPLSSKELLEGPAPVQSVASQIKEFIKKEFANL